MKSNPLIYHGVQPAVHGPHAAQDDCECGPTHNRKFTQNVMRFFCCCSYVLPCIYCVVQDNSSSSSVVQRCQGVGHPWWVKTFNWKNNKRKFQALWKAPMGLLLIPQLYNGATSLALFRDISRRFSQDVWSLSSAAIPPPSPSFCNMLEITPQTCTAPNFDAIWALNLLKCLFY